MSVARKLRWRRVVFLFLLILLILFVIRYYRTPPETFRVKRLISPKTINVGDHSLDEWDSSFVVLEITPPDASRYQWNVITDYKPAQVVPGDFGIKVYMARDTSYWYIALDATDDKVISANPPYSGDCLEVFFAGKHLDSPLGMHQLVNASEKQAALFQFELPAPGSDNTVDYFPEYRTDIGFRKLVRSEFMASRWLTNVGWSAEARIPLGALDRGVLIQLYGNQSLKMNIDYLDYDVRPAERTAQSYWGFKPDNVFCLDNEEKLINVPKYMRSVMFE